MNEADKEIRNTALEYYNRLDVNSKNEMRNTALENL